jgi:hypothetical protein
LRLLFRRISPALPGGLQLNSTSGRIYGSPAVTSPYTIYLVLGV